MLNKNCIINSNFLECVEKENTYIYFVVWYIGSIDVGTFISIRVEQLGILHTLARRQGEVLAAGPRPAP